MVWFIKLVASIATVLSLPQRVHAAIDTWEHGDLTPPSTLLTHTNDMETLCPPRHLKASSSSSFTKYDRPVPTNAWWSNLIACANGTNTVVSPIWPNPLAISMETQREVDGLYGFGMSYPFRNRFFSPESANDGAVRYYSHAIRRELVLSAVEFASKKPAFQVVDWTDLGVQVEMTSDVTVETAPSITSYFVSGMAFFTATYHDLSPRVLLETPIATINGASLAVGNSVSSTRFVIESVAGNQWVLYASTSITLKLESLQILKSMAVFDGTLRLAVVLPSTPISVYDTYQSCILTGGAINLKHDASYAFEWETSGDCSSGLLHFALPHHVATLDPSFVSLLNGVTLSSTTRGLMQAYVTTSSPPQWAFTERMTMPVSFYPLNRPSATAAAQQNLLLTLRGDIMTTWSISAKGSMYFNGKAAQKYASLCLMANDQSIVGSDVSLLRKCVTKLERAIAPFLTNDWFYKLQYDQVYGGIVSSQGFVTGDLNADFGNTVYNDHHYHYGYWIYCAAVINYLHPTWQRIEELNRMTNLLVRDVATPNDVDPFFPKFRTFDWFRGHSYSHGVTPFADGKDQESTSEDVNFSYSLYLYGHATNNQRMRSTGRLMTRLNARAIQTYFLMENTNQVHPPQFIRNKVTGILFDNKADYATWFCAEKYCIHGIQMLPLTPITQFVRTKTFVQEEWDQVLSNDASVVNQELTNPWLSLLYANYASVNKPVALQMLQSLAMDDGLTRSWALYISLAQ